jgi:hypothetical protein
MFHNDFFTFSAFFQEALVPCSKTQPPWEFLLSASRNSLQSYELSRLSHAANLRKEIGSLFDQWIDETACAMLARLLMDQRERPTPAPEPPAAEEVLPQKENSRSHFASDNVFADRAAAPSRSAGSA